MDIVKIPLNEYKERIAKAAKIVADMGLDVLVVNSTESDFANVRYFSGFWPLFERAGVAISASGKAALMVGMESKIFAADYGNMENIFVLLDYRESADPAYPEANPNTFRDVFESLGVKGDKIRIGVASWLDTTMVMMDGLKKCYPEAEIVRSDQIMVTLRKIKSPNEIACMRQGFKIVEYATQKVIEALKPGVTECQMVGIAQQAIYEKGAEYEGLPMYVFCEKSTSHAISRSRPDRVIGKNDMVQLNLSARVDGYSPSVGIPVCMGKLSPERRAYVEFGKEAHFWTQEQIKAGVLASDIAKNFYQMFVDTGHKDNFVYGPCHGTGMIEVESPWMETVSNYPLEPNMTFQIDTSLSAPDFGLRWEKGIAVTETGCDPLCQSIGKIYELGF
ncbi:MAG: M24 family metallopeptidase, partial [Thermoguttaceae bacterium]|nr:M24 family metallopeptidase [Thermoguttaceae bacterium]